MALIGNLIVTGKSNLIGNTTASLITATKFITSGGTAALVVLGTGNLSNISALASLLSYDNLSGKPFTSAQGSTMYSWYTTITGPDAETDTTINKWKEIVDFLANIDDTSELNKILTGKQDKVTQLGSTTEPVYISAAGIFAECLQYAGGTNVTLNGTNKSATTAEFYAPTGAGTNNYILKSNGSDAPTWIAQSSIAAGQVTTVTRSTDANHYLTFVDSNNSTATAESIYTDSELFYNPSSNTLTTTNYTASGIITIDNTNAAKHINFTRTTYNYIIAPSGKIIYNTNCTTANSTVSIDVTNKRLGVCIAEPAYNLHVVGTSNITGAVTLGSTLSVNGISTLKNTTINGTLTVSGITQINNTATIDQAHIGNLYVTGNVEFRKVTLTGKTVNDAILAFSREKTASDNYGLNYITFPSTGYLAISTSNSSGGIVGLFNTNSFIPYINNTKTIGDATHKWNEIYAYNINGNSYKSSCSTGQPYACESTTLNNNLNADLLDGKHYSLILDDAFNKGLTTITKTLTLTTNWQDTGIEGTDLSTGTYIILLYDSSEPYVVVNGSNSAKNGQWNMYYSGVMSWFGTGTNGGFGDEIILHRAGHACSNKTIYLRTYSSRNTEDKKMKLLIACSSNGWVADEYQFKFKKII